MNDKEKLDELIRLTGLDPVAIGQQIKQEAEALGLESKEAKDTVEDVAEPEPVEAPAVETAPAGVGLTAEDIGAAIANAIVPLMQRIDELEKSLAEPTPEEKQVEDEPTPVDLIMAAYKSRVVGADETRVDGRTKEGRDGPAQVETNATPKVQGDSLPAQILNNIYGGGLLKSLKEMQ